LGKEKGKGKKDQLLQPNWERGQTPANKGKKRKGKKGEGKSLWKKKRKGKEGTMIFRPKTGERKRGREEGFASRGGQRSGKPEARKGNEHQSRKKKASCAPPTREKKKVHIVVTGRGRR